MRNVLVIDDSSTTRLYYRDNLARLGFVVREAINGIEGLELAVQDRFDLILVDLNMPKMDGYTFLDQLRRRSEAPTAPVVMISTLAREAGRAKALAVGANGYLVKPVNPDELAAYCRLMTGGAPATGPST